MPFGVGYGAGQGFEAILAEKYREQLLKQQQQQIDQVHGRFLTERGDRQQAATAQTARDAADQQAFEAFVVGLPEHLQGAARGRGQFGMTFAPDDFVNAPETREQAAARTLRELTGELTTREQFEDPPAPSLIWSTRPDGSQVRVADAAGVVNAAPPKANNLRMIDPTFPPEIQSEVLRLRANAPTFEAAVSQVVPQLELWRQAHPNLSPQKVLDALRQSYSGSGGQADPFDDLKREILGGDQGAPAGRASGPGPRAGAGPVPGAGPGGDAALAQAAAQVLRQNGYEPTPENVSRFLANPANRAKLTGGGQ